MSEAAVMKAISIGADLHGADHPSLSLSCATGGNCPQATEIPVSQSRHDHIRAAEDELDDAIADLKTLSALALDAGDETRAIEFSRRMVRTILSRTPAHQDRLAREHLAAVERSLDQGVDFFQVEGRRAAQERKAA